MDDKNWGRFTPDDLPGCVTPTHVKFNSPKITRTFLDKAVYRYTHGDADLTCVYDCHEASQGIPELHDLSERSSEKEWMKKLAVARRSKIPMPMQRVPGHSMREMPKKVLKLAAAQRRCRIARPAHRVPGHSKREKPNKSFTLPAAQRCRLPRPVHRVPGHSKREMPEKALKLPAALTCQRRCRIPRPVHRVPGHSKREMPIQTQSLAADLRGNRIQGHSKTGIATAGHRRCSIPGPTNRVPGHSKRGILTKVKSSYVAARRCRIPGPIQRVPGHSERESPIKLRLHKSGNSQLAEMLFKISMRFRSIGRKLGMYLSKDLVIRNTPKGINKFSRISMPVPSSGASRITHLMTQSARDPVASPRGKITKTDSEGMVSKTQETKRPYPRDNFPTMNRFIDNLLKDFGLSDVSRRG